MSNVEEASMGTQSVYARKQLTASSVPVKVRAVPAGMWRAPVSGSSLAYGRGLLRNSTSILQVHKMNLQPPSPRC